LPCLSDAPAHNLFSQLYDFFNGLLTILPEFQAAILTDNKLSLSWSAESGASYQLQFNSDLSSSNWTNLGDPAIATGSTLILMDSVTNVSQRFYRLALSP
jgi:hypothetical protein